MTDMFRVAMKDHASKDDEHGYGFDPVVLLNAQKVGLLIYQSLLAIYQHIDCIVCYQQLSSAPD